MRRIGVTREDRSRHRSLHRGRAHRVRGYCLRRK